ncbi:hypothetical protein F2Q68_00003183 [Brassica cretica]|uniref:Uncharacterized protein n=1 Tax=Brassica cretica TaxID=69181 RepID=A0A8S9JAW4_BRACR|nr:hypothetical protein F2Q68_00003183 [Brassica cretica]
MHLLQERQLTWSNPDYDQKKRKILTCSGITALRRKTIEGCCWERSISSGRLLPSSITSFEGYMPAVESLGRDRAGIGTVRD